VAVYVALWWVMATASGFLLGNLLEYLPAVVLTSLIAACFANWLAMRIYENRPMADIGLRWNGCSVRNALLGFAGGAGAAALVLAGPLAAGLAHMRGLTGAEFHWRILAFVAVMLLAGAAGEEILFRGYGFQMLIRTLGPMGAVAPVGVLFALLHAGNPNATPLGLANTAGFGILFGYAFLRSRDLWLPIGLHFGWNFTLPLFGVNISGLRIRVTGYELSWTAGKLWSGGEYGPEASILTAGVLILLAAYLWKAPVRRQSSPLTNPPAENAVCEPSPLSPS
jgi:membrane protease YdiL (CAAX protease family)